MNYLQESFLESMHKHSFSNMILKLSLNCHHIQLRSCACPSLIAWIFICPIISSFRMAFNIFSLALQTRLGFPHPMVHGFSQCIYGQVIDPRGIHLFCCAHGGEHRATHDLTRLMQILFLKLFLLKKWLQQLQPKQKLCHIATNILRMISSF